MLENRIKIIISFNTAIAAFSRSMVANLNLACSRSSPFRFMSRLSCETWSFADYTQKVLEITILKAILIFFIKITIFAVNYALPDLSAPPNSANHSGVYLASFYPKPYVSS